LETGMSAHTAVAPPTGLEDEKREIKEVLA
jgi:hypothetical protein